MGKWGKIIGIAVLLIVSAATAGEYIEGQYPSATLRYKITVSVETPEGVKAGSAVREVFIQRQPELPESGPHIEPRGEAVVVDLGKRGAVFALTSFDDYRVIFEAFPYEHGGLTVEGLRYYSQLKNVKAALEPKNYPMLVTFKDINDPKTVMKMIETEWCLEKNKDGTCINEQFHIVADHFEEIFGQGVKLKEMAIEMSDEPLTEKINLELPWLTKIGEKYLHGGFTSRQSPLGLDGGNFREGF